MVALAAGYLAGTANSTDVVEPPTTADVHAAVASAAPSRNIARSVGARSPADELTRALRHVRDSLPASPDLPVDAPITGTVLDETKAPVAGVVVRARPEIDEPEEDDDDVPIVDVAAHRIAWLHQVREDTVTATTRADGTFRLDGVRRGLTYDVEVRADEYESTSSSNSAIHPGDAVSLRVARLAAIVVSVDGASDVPPTVETAGPLEPDDKPSFDRSTWSFSRPTLWVRPGRWVVRATAGESVADVVTTETELGRSAEARLTLIACGQIECAVAWPTGLDRKDVEMTATRNGGASEQESVSGELQDDGRVLMHRLRPGRWTVAVAYPSQRVVETRDVDVAPNACIRLHFDLPEPDARDFVVVRAFDACGAPIEHARVTSTEFCRWCCSPYDGPAAAEIAPGVYRAFHAGLPSADNSFRVYVSGGGACEGVEYSLGADAEVVVGLSTTASLDVRIGAEHRSSDRFGENGSWTSADEDEIVHLGMRREDDLLLVRDDDLDCAMLLHRPTEGVVEWAPRPLRALRVTSDASGPAYDAGLRDGDVIVGVDGEEFRDAPHREAVWAAALARGRCRLDILRDGKSMWVAMDASLFRHDRAEAKVVPWVR